MAAGAATRRNVGRVSPTWWVLLGSLAVQVASKDSDDLVRGPVQPSPIRVPVLRRAYDGAPEHGRRLVGEISGNLETLGYYAANVCIGSPGSMHQLIIDTGSSMTAVPCATCTTCGRHKNPKYNPVRSLTSKRLGCKNPPFHMRCSRCENTQCGYAVSYTEGSQIRGAVFTDHVHFGDGLTAFTERMVVGCQTHETGLFKGQVADGIMGISATRSGGLASPTPIDRLVELRRIQNTFSFCLADHTGQLVLGGTVRPERAAEVQWLPMRDQKFYSLALNDIQLDGQSFRVDRRKYAATIIDTGTTFLYLPPDAYRRLKEYFTTRCPWGACVSRKYRTRYNDEFCYSMRQSEWVQFATLSLHFDGSHQPLHLSPAEYTYEIKAKGALPAAMTVRCLAAFDNKHNGVVLGAAVLRNREVILDRANGRVGFVRTDCARVQPSTSILANNTFLSDRCGQGRGRKLDVSNASALVPGKLVYQLAGGGTGDAVGSAAAALAAHNASRRALRPQPDRARWQ